MSARRGSLRFKVARFATAPLGRGQEGAARRDFALRAIGFGGRVVAAVAAFLIATTVGLQFWRVGVENYRLHRQIQSVERQNERLKSEAASLAREIRLLHDPEYLVPMIHEQLGLTRPHEVIVQVATPSPAPILK